MALQYANLQASLRGNSLRQFLRQFCHEIRHRFFTQVDCFGPTTGNEGHVGDASHTQDKTQVLAGDVAVADRRSLLVAPARCDQ